MNKQQQDIIDKAYENYCNEYQKDNSIGLCLLVARVDGKSTYSKPSKEMFVDLCTYDSEFMEKFGLMIVEKYLTAKERLNILPSYNMDAVNEFRFSNIIDVISVEELDQILNESLVPTKLIIVTYKDKIIKNYEN